MTTIKIEYNDQQVTRAIRRIIRTGTDMTPLMRRIAGHLQASAKQSFDDQKSPDGTAWKKLKPSTLKQRKKSGKVPAKILTRDGDLARSLLADWDATSAVVGTNLAYATTHQFGAKKGQFGRFSIIGTRQEVPIPWGNIPARPFLGISTKATTQIQDEVLSFITKRWK